MKKYGIIYKITNKINGKAYIGQTIRKNPMIRINSHFQKFQPRGHNKYLFRSICKYGKSNFKIELLYTAFDKEELNDSEILLIKFHNTISPKGYNLKEGGNQGGKCKESTKKIISEKNKQYWATHKHPFKGKKFTKEHIENLSKVRKGFTSSARKKAAQKWVEINKKPIKAIEINTKKEYVFESIIECANVLNLNASNISRTARNDQNRKQHKGYRFEYIERAEYRRKKKDETK